ncbi:MAG: TorF family putative porin [Bacteroidota bacterium]
MKKTLVVIVAGLLILTAFTQNVKAQEWNMKLDIYSSYIWRGLKFGSGPAFQPTIEFNKDGFAIGAWGSVNASIDEAAEVDLYASYGFDLSENTSLSFMVTDYYYPGTDWLSGESHFIEPLVSLGVGAFTFTAAYMTGENVSDIYLEAAVTAGPVDIILGGGDGQYTYDGDLGISNIGLRTAKEITITDSFVIPVSGSVVLNPSTEQFYLVVGITLQ